MVGDKVSHNTATMDDETQQNILEKLMEYGDSLLEENSPTPHSTSKRRIIKRHHSNTSDDAVRKKKMKKKKKKKTVSVNASNEKYGKEKKNSLKDFEEELKLFQATQKEKSLEKEDITVLDRRKTDDGQKKKKRRAPEVIVFDDPTKRKKKSHAKPESRPGSEGVELTEGEVDLDQARHEVWKFGISGLSFDDKEKQEAAKAIQLGAKPPKREFVNYKELMETNRQKKIEERQQREIDRQMGLKISKKKEGKIQLQNKGFWTDKTQRKGVYVDGQLGKYKRGVQVFSKRELAKIKNQRGKGKR